MSENMLVLRALEQADWSLRGAARLLDISPTVLVRLIDRHSLRDMYAKHQK